MKVLEIPETGLLSRADAAALLGKSKISLMRWEKEGLARGTRKLKSIRVGNSIFYEASELRRFLGLDAPKPEPIEEDPGPSEATKARARAHGLKVK